MIIPFSKVQENLQDLLYRNKSKFINYDCRLQTPSLVR